ncbi:MAG: NAD(P)H-hydrate dehydratase, partial [Gammaproteobacteria bacterium]|nr:NAD(P)H-hydrate dehydratase [Gammaproteobacteria bacterium]
MKSLSDKLYSVDSIVQLEQIAIKQFSIPAYELMKRAGEAVFNVIKMHYPERKNILVLCGSGNNAGDGYVVASLAKRAGFDVTVVSIIPPETLNNEALLAYKDWLSLSKNSQPDLTLLDGADIIIDALLGTGLSRNVSHQYETWIKAVNTAAKPVIAVDIPSGLLADTGVISGHAIKADKTVCFIGLKQGMYTAQAKDVCGQIILDSLALPAQIYEQVACSAHLLNAINYSLLPIRKASSHKGCFGHVLLVGGNDSMPGALILAATAALRAGAGLLTIITIAKHLTAISTAVPEAMIKTCEIDSVATLFDAPFINSVTHVAIGMGLGQDDWSLAMLQNCLQLQKPILLDADALNLFAKHKLIIRSPVVITPHPGEAARLLNGTEIFASIDIQQNRFDAIKKLHALVNTVESCVVLKGSGTLLFDGQVMKVCNLGSAAMATPGMGDVLSGICIALMAQHIKITDAVELAVCLHAAAADYIAKDKTRGLLASDVV